VTKVSRVQGLPTVLAQHQCNALRHVVVERLCHARHGAVPEECHRTRRSQTTCWVSQALPLRRNYVEVQLANELWMSFFLHQERVRLRRAEVRLSKATEVLQGAVEWCWNTKQRKKGNLE